jgi:putative ABC transport system substrate-binding protein
MRRRDFITSIGGMAALSLSRRVLQAPQPALSVIGWLGATPLKNQVGVESFQRGLGEVGCIEGRDFKIEYRWPRKRDMSALPDVAADLVSQKVNVIFAAGGEPVATAAKAATSTIPIVFSAVDDPIRLGLVASLSRPGGNITGVSIFNSETNAKRLSLLHELVPQVKTMGLLVWPVPDIENQSTDVSNAARSLGIALHVVDVQNAGGLEAAFDVLASEKVGAFMVHPTTYAMIARKELASLAARRAIPAIYPAREFVLAGGLIGYGVNFPDIYRQDGTYVGRILKGEKPAELPVQRPTKFDFALNLKTAKTLGLTVPPQMLALADEVIE